MPKNYLWYQFLRYVVVKPALRLFHSQTIVRGTEHIPRDKPILFVANHQNSFLDALHVVCNTDHVIHFLTRAEPFNVPGLAPVLRSLNMLPVYRVRDGFSSIRKTEETFDECYTKLKRGDSVLVFAEANHDLKRRVRPLSKGFTRIAFGAEEQYGWNLDLQVIPVGLNYGQHRKAQTPVRIEFGEPILVRDFRKAYLDDNRKAAHLLKQTTTECLKNVTMHVPKLDHYPLHHLLLDELEPNRSLLINPEVANSRVNYIEKHFDSSLLKEAKILWQEADKHNVHIHDFNNSKRITVNDILLCPVFIFTLLNNAIPYQIIRWITNEYIEDHVFDGSAKFVSGLFLLPFYYLLVCVFWGLASTQIPFLLLYFFLSIITAPYFVRAKDLLIKNTAQQLKKEKPDVYKSIKSRVDRFKQLGKEYFLR